MTPFEIGLIMSGVLLVLVVLGMRVAFAAAFVGVVGLIAIFAQKLGFERGVVVAIKMAGTIPHSKSVEGAFQEYLVPESGTAGPDLVVSSGRLRGRARF